MILRRQAKDTLAAVEMLHGDTLEFRLRSGGTIGITLVSTGAEIACTTLKKPGVEEPGARTVYHF